MHTVPEHLEGREAEEERRRDTGEVVHVFNRMHRQPREGFDIHVAVVKAMDVAVEERDVNEAMRPVEVEASPDRNEPRGKGFARQHPRAARVKAQLGRRHKGETAARKAPHEEHLPYGPLQRSEGGVPHVVQTVYCGRCHVGAKLALQFQLRRADPETVVGVHETQVYHCALQHPSQ